MFSRSSSATSKRDAAAPPPPRDARGVRNAAAVAAASAWLGEPVVRPRQTRPSTAGGAGGASADRASNSSNVVNIFGGLNFAPPPPEPPKPPKPPKRPSSVTSKDSSETGSSSTKGAGIGAGSGAGIGGFGGVFGVAGHSGGGSGTMGNGGRGVGGGAAPGAGAGGGGGGVFGSGGWRNALTPSSARSAPGPGGATASSSSSSSSSAAHAPAPCSSSVAISDHTLSLSPTMSAASSSDYHYNNHHQYLNYPNHTNYHFTPPFSSSSSSTGRPPVRPARSHSTASHIAMSPPSPHTTTPPTIPALNTTNLITTSISTPTMSPSISSSSASMASMSSPRHPAPPSTPLSPRSGSIGHGNSSKIPPSPQPSASSPVDEVLPFVTSPFAAWDVAAAGEVPGAAVAKKLGDSATKGSPAAASTWYEPPRKRGSVSSRKTWRDGSGNETVTVYRVGWEREVLDLEARLHETMYDVTGGHHTFVDVEDKPPSTVLDLGTGTGLWPIAQALEWPNTRFIAADMVPCQTDLRTLVDAEERARSSVGGAPGGGEGMWGSVYRRIEFQQYNFLDGLPYDSGVFDMVHMRFLGLGVPETRWPDLLDEAVRVLRPGGVLEIVEISYETPPHASDDVRSRFASMMHEFFVPTNPVLALQMHLPATAGLVASTTRPVLSASWDTAEVGRSLESQAPDAIADAPMTWISSALGYKGTPRGPEGARVTSALASFDPTRWQTDTDMLSQSGHSHSGHGGGGYSSNGHGGRNVGAAPSGAFPFSSAPGTPGTPSTTGMPVTPGVDGTAAASSGKIVLSAWVVFKNARGRAGSAPQSGPGVGLGMGLAT